MAQDAHGSERWELPRIPVVLAPMAGGPSTPQLVAAVSAAGGFGMLAGGYLSADRLRDLIAETRTLTRAPFGVNLFVPPIAALDPVAVRRYADECAADFAAVGAGPGDIAGDRTDGWDAKLAVIEEMRPALVTTMFGRPGIDVVGRMSAAGIPTGVTVTSVAESQAALEVGARVLIVQGPAAGGHRAIFDPAATSDDIPLDALVPEVRALTRGIVLAGGGLATREDTRRMLDLGADAAVFGTAFLRADEAGTRPAHRSALAQPDFATTVVTRAFTGRPARALTNGFTRAHPDAPTAYPEIHALTAPMRAAAAAVGDLDRLHLWAGTGYRSARPASGRTIVADLAP